MQSPTRCRAIKPDPDGMPAPASAHRTEARFSETYKQGGQVASTTERHLHQASDEPASLAQVLHREFRALRPQWLAGISAPAKQSASDAERCRSLRETYARTAPTDGADSRPLSALCLSGGGIRSATFNL